MNTQWKQRFDEKYNSFELCDKVSKPEYDRLKDFIQKEIDTALEKQAEEIITVLENQNMFRDPKIEYLKSKYLQQNKK